MKYTSRELSEKLADNGCKLNSEWWSVVDTETGKVKIIPSAYSELHGYLKNYYAAGNRIKGKEIYPAYDILNDICVRYREEFFGKNESFDTKMVFALIQDGEIEEAENHIWENCKFNSKNHGK